MGAPRATAPTWWAGRLCAHLRNHPRSYAAIHLWASYTAMSSLSTPHPDSTSQGPQRCILILTLRGSTVSCSTLLQRVEVPDTTGPALA